MSVTIVMSRALLKVKFSSGAIANLRAFLVYTCFAMPAKPRSRAMKAMKAMKSSRGSTSSRRHSSKPLSLRQEQRRQRDLTKLIKLEELDSCNDHIADLELILTQTRLALARNYKKRSDIPDAIQNYIPLAKRPASASSTRDSIA